MPGCLLAATTLEQLDDHSCPRLIGCEWKDAGYTAVRVATLPADGDGLAYDTDLLALANATGHAPDSELQAELAGFTALLNEHQADREETS